MQPFRFDDPHENWWIETQLADLAVALSAIDGLQVVYAPRSFVNVPNGTLAISTFWESLQKSERVQVQKADVYLRALGNVRETDWSVVRKAWSQFEGTAVHHFYQQLLCVGEDSRLERSITQVRPGTAPALRLRRDKYAQYLRQNRRARERAGQTLDVLLTDVYAALADQGFQKDGRETELGAALLHPTMRLIEELETATSTQAVVDATTAYVLAVLDAGSGFEDASYQLFTFETQRNDAPSVLERTPVDPKLAARKALQEMSKGAADETKQREDVEVWTQEQDTKATGALAMETNDSQGSPSAQDQARIGQDNPQSVVARRGQSDMGQFEDHGESDEESALRLRGVETQLESEPIQVHMVPRSPITPEAREHVRTWQRETEAIRRKLLKLFERTLLHQMQARQFQTRHGRLDKRLTKMVTDAFPRPFYHKSSRDKPFDVAVQMLVDCSGSMYSRLEPLKPLIYLFHETLCKAQIAHDICGFWEDTLSASILKESRPVTHLLHVIEWKDAWTVDTAGHIDELEPQLDNRDGFAIRQVGRQLMDRTERQKWLVILSDGEPAAQDYRDAVLDTKNAIRSLTATGVQIIHLCLADEDKLQSVETMRQMYGPNALVVGRLADVPQALERTISTIVKRAAR